MNPARTGAGSAVAVLVGVAILLTPPAISGQNVTPSEAANEAQKKANAATKEADDAKVSYDALGPNTKTKDDKDAEKADEQAAKDEQAAREAQEKLDKSQANFDANKPGSAAQQKKDQTEANTTAQKAVDSEKAAEKADAKANAGQGQGFYQKNYRDKLRAKRKALQDAWVKKRQAEGLPIPSWALPKTISLGPLRPGIGGGETCAALISAGKVKIDSSGTGETIGHIADLRIQNLTDTPINCAVPPMMLESGSGKNQHYACPKGQTVDLPPHGENTVPMDGVCLNRNKPPVGKGVTGDLVVNEGNPRIPKDANSHVPARDVNKLLRVCTAKYDAAEKLLKEGALKDIPYADPKKKKDIVVQWSMWTDPQLSRITGAPPATRDDLKKVVYKQLEPQGPLIPDTKRKVDKGIDTIFEKVELTTAKAKDLEKPEENALSG